MSVQSWPSALGQPPHRHVGVGVAERLGEGVEIAILGKDGAASIAAVEDRAAGATQGVTQGPCHGGHSGQSDARRVVF